MSNVIAASLRFKSSSPATYVAIAPSGVSDDLPIKFAFAANSYATAGNGNEYKNFEFTWAEVRDTFLSTPAVAPNGDKMLCSVFTAELAGGARKGDAVVSVSLFVLDIDTGGTMEETASYLRANGLEGVVAPSISFGKSRTTISEGHYVKWAKERGLPSKHTPESVKEFLTVKKKLLPRVIVESTVLEETQQTQDGIVIVVTHPPLEKHRGVMPMDRRLVIADHMKDSTTQDDVKIAFADAYLKAADATGLAYDASCKDIARMYYLPHVYRKDLLATWPKAIHVQGKASPFLPFFEAALNARKTHAKDGPPPKKTHSPADVPLKERGPRPNKTFEYKNLDLVKWAAQHAKSFPIASLLEERGVAPILGQRSDGGVFIECPFEDEHSGPSPHRTFVVDGDGDKGFVVYCSGNACQSVERDRLEFLQKMLQDGWLIIEQLGGPQPSKRDKIEEEVSKITSQTSTDVITRILKSIQEVKDDIFAARMDKKIGKLLGLTPSQIKKLRLSSSRPERDRDVFYPGDNDFKQDTDKVKERLLTANLQELRLFRMGAGNVRIDLKNRCSTRFDERILRHEVNRISKFRKVAGADKDGNPIFKDISCPLDYASDVFCADDLHFPALTKITDLPFFDSEGNLVTTAGYHAASMSYYIPAEGFDLPPVSPTPTREEVERGVALLMGDALVDFPFVGDFSRAHALAMLLQTASRELINGATPFYLVDKTGPGTGGGFLADTVAGIVLGESCPMTTEKGDPDEVRKSVTTSALAGLAFYCIDNVHETIKDRTLASAITSGMYQDRMLGSNTQVKVPIKWVWMGIGNGVTLSEELARRTVLIKLDTGLENPSERAPESFKHFPLADWVKGNRPELVWAVLTIIQAWVAAGKPLAKTVKILPSFESWSRVMGGILDVAGVKGLLGDRDVVKESARGVSSTFKSFIRVWWDTFGEAPVSVGTLDVNPDPIAHPATLVELLFLHAGAFTDFEFTSRIKTSWGSRLARLIGAHNGRVFGVGETVRLSRQRGDTNKWVLTETDDAVKAGAPLDM